MWAYGIIACFVLFFMLLSIAKGVIFVMGALQRVPEKAVWPTTLKLVVIQLGLLGFLLTQEPFAVQYNYGWNGELNSTHVVYSCTSWFVLILEGLLSFVTLSLQRQLFSLKGKSIPQLILPWLPIVLSLSYVIYQNSLSHEWLMQHGSG
jgi:hypothetical protein